jgi:hypothetical protein
MIRDRTLQARDKLIGKLPVSSELLRGSLLERTVRQRAARNARVAKGIRCSC